MEELTNYKQHIDNAISWLWAALPNLIMAIIIFFVGLWVIRFINKMVRKFFERKDYDETLETFLQSFMDLSRVDGGRQ